MAVIGICHVVQDNGLHIDIICIMGCIIGAIAPASKPVHGLAIIGNAGGNAFGMPNPLADAHPLADAQGNGNGIGH